MKRINATSEASINATDILIAAQQYFASSLEGVNSIAGFKGKFTPVEWFRNNGAFGGGVRLVAPTNEFFNTASINFSQVQYEADDAKTLRAATALSTIIHPANPKAPSYHMHVSLTEMKSGESYWRIMADLNPSIPNEVDIKTFDQALKNITGSYYKEGLEQGDKYFYIPVLKRHRGVCHFYLEKLENSSLAEPFLKAVIDCYVGILKQYASNEPFTKDDLKKQLAYHTLYFYQVLTLDRGTTSGLLVHNENDTGILGSLPTHINKQLLLDWQKQTPFPQNELVTNLVNALPENGDITGEVKQQLANVVRAHYKKHPEAINMQASGNVIPPTVQNHK